MAHILISGHNGSGNKGCEALLRCTSEICLRHFEHSDIKVISEYPDADKRAIGNEIPELTILKGPETDPPKWTYAWLMDRLEYYIFDRYFAGRPHHSTRTFLHHYTAADIVISIGGDTFSDDYDGPQKSFGELELARQQGAFTMIWGASIGPFYKSVSLEQRWVKALKRINLITVREDRSLHYLRDLGVTDNVVRVADPAFLLQPNPQHDQILPDNKKFIGLGMSAIVADYGGRYQAYLDAFCQFSLDLLQQDTHHYLLLIPHVITNNNDDAAVCTDLADKIRAAGGDESRFQIIDSALNARQIKHVISQCYTFIGARTHSTIAAFSTKVPTISIAYSVKARGINKDIFGHEDYVLPVADTTYATLKDKYQLLENQREEIIATYTRRIPMLKQAAESNGEHLAQRYHDFLKKKQ